MAADSVAIYLEPDFYDFKWKIIYIFSTSDRM